MSTFDKFVTSKKLSETEVVAFVSFISRYYSGPLYTRTWEEISEFYKKWLSKLKKKR